MKTFEVFFFGIVAGAGRAYLIPAGQIAKDWLIAIKANQEEALLRLKSYAQSSPDQVRDLLLSIKNELPDGFYEQVFK